MVLTSTATNATYDVVVQRLCTENPTVGIHPDRGNIMFRVNPKATREELCDRLCKEFTDNAEPPKTILYVRHYRDCSDLYLSLERQLGEKFTKPSGYPNIAEFRVVEMYSRVLTNKKRNKCSQASLDVTATFALL